MFPIGKLAIASHCKIPTIRYYEDIGLLSKARRSAGNQRTYEEGDLVRLRFIRHRRELGFDLKAIAKIQLEATYSRRARLQNLAEELEQMLVTCDDSEDHQGQVLEVLTNHELRQHH